MAESRTALCLASAEALAIFIVHSSPARAQIVGRAIEFSGGAGIMSPDARSLVKSGMAVRGSVGLRFLSGFVLEGHGMYAPSEADTAPNPTHSLLMGGVDLRWNLRPAESKSTPYFFAGVGYGSSTVERGKPENLSRGAATLGMGVLLNVIGPRNYVRIEARDILFRDRGQREFSHDIALTIGLQRQIGGRTRDQDLDRVRDWLDRCPDTPIGATVDANGCPKDSDGDAVLDGIDQCANTPKGCTVDKKGCPSDADKDGVCDGVDTCPDTRAGATVNATGCPSDPDGDGVWDGIDKCTDTPKGCTVDENGCPGDSDKDGVCDGVDVCPNTPEGLGVDAHGCPIEVNEKEIQLLDTGMIRLENIEFETRKAVLRPAAIPRIEEAGRVLQQYPQLRVEIGGHTDNRGTRALNDTLSESRARAVLEHLKEKFTSIPADQYTTKGYGFSRPIAPNATDAGRARNRRVEFKVLNTGALRIERNKRRMLRTGETAPRDTSRMVPTPAPPDTTRRMSLPPEPIGPPSPAPRDTMQPAPPDTTRR